MKKLFSEENNIPHLKKASVSDIPILLELEKTVSGTDVYSPMLEENEWKEELKNSEVYLIEKNGAVAGNLSYERKNDDYIHITGLVVIPTFQRQGVARKVLTSLLEKFKNIKRIDLAAHPDNYRALKLYQSLGFAVESLKENYYGDGEPRLILSLTKKQLNNKDSSLF
jgi:ribosomal protein S18 acetylase RimI-like enzyme